MVLEQIFPAADGKDSAGADGYSQRNCHLWGAHTAAEEKRESSSREKLCTDCNTPQSTELVRM